MSKLHISNAVQRMVVFESLPTERQDKLILMTLYHLTEKDEKNPSLAAETLVPRHTSHQDGFSQKGS